MLPWAALLTPCCLAGLFRNPFYRGSCMVVATADFFCPSSFLAIGAGPVNCEGITAKLAITMAVTCPSEPGRVRGVYGRRVNGIEGNADDASSTGASHTRPLNVARVCESAISRNLSTNWVVNLYHSTQATTSPTLKERPSFPR